MKLALSIFLFLCVSRINPYCQENFNIIKAKSFYIDIKNKSFEGKQKIPFKEIIVKDYRFDTTKVGYIVAWDKNDGTAYKKIDLGNNSSDKLTEMINKYFKNNLNSSAQTKLVVFIKTLWLQKGALDFTSDEKIRNKNIDEDKSGVCTAEFDVYYFNDNNYIPVDFESFKKNKVLYPEFTLNHSNFTDEIYIQKGSNKELLTDYWGFFDGMDLYIKIGFNCVKLIRQNNTWDLYGNKYLTVIHNKIQLPYFAEIKTRKRKIENRPLQLNMETGKVY